MAGTERRRGSAQRWFARHRTAIHVVVVGLALVSLGLLTAGWVRGEQGGSLLLLAVVDLGVLLVGAASLWTTRRGTDAGDGRGD